MREKLNPIYSLSVEVDNGVNTSPLTVANKANKSLTFELPYQVDFEISRQTQSSAQTGTFTIHGLGEVNRDAIQKDVTQFEQLRAIQFRAGYQSLNAGFMPLIFNGQVLQAYSHKPEGGQWRTVIEAYDGGMNMAYGNVSMTLSPGQTASSVITQLAKLLPIQLGSPIVGGFPTKNLRGEVLFGNIWDIIQQKSNGLAFIDNGQVKALNYSEVFNGSTPVISIDSGLLGSPRRTTAQIDFDMMFEPGLTLGQQVQLISEDTSLNRQWKILGVEHSGVISLTEGGRRVTTVKLLDTKEALQLIGGSSS